MKRTYKIYTNSLYLNINANNLIMATRTLLQSSWVDVSEWFGGFSEKAQTTFRGFIGCELPHVLSRLVLTSDPRAKLILRNINLMEHCGSWPAFKTHVWKNRWRVEYSRKIARETQEGPLLARASHWLVQTGLKLALIHWALFDHLHAICMLAITEKQ